MLDETELLSEHRTNREKLRSTIPNRLVELLTVIDAKRDRIEKWYADLLIKMGNSVIRVCLDLSKGIDDEDGLPAAAWNARNLLELWVWLKYCSMSLGNARRFHEDAIRDLVGLVEAHARICSIIKIENEHYNANLSAIAELGSSQSIESVNANYLRVAQAADEFGLGDAYRAYNAHLSKFAHPTAGLVIGVMHQDDMVRHMQSNCTTMGLFYGGQCVIVLSEIVSKLPSAK